jgi:uncharacterized protein YcnI
MKAFRGIGVACLLAGALLPQQALAHATVTPKFTTQGSYQRLAFSVWHNAWM